MAYDGNTGENQGGTGKPWVAVYLEHARRESLWGPHILPNWIRMYGGMNIAKRPPLELALAGHDSGGLGPHIVRELVQVGE
jgi:hypothetical protein